MATRQVNIVVKARDEAKRKIAGIAAVTDTLSTSLRRAALAGLAFFSGRALLRQGQEITNIMVQEEAAAKKLEQALIATGGAAGFSAEQLQQYADDLQDVTTFGDDAIVTAESILATFKQIKGDVFKETLLRSLDIATALGRTKDLTAQIIQLGKAVNDPVKGMAALNEVGIQFNETQAKQIKKYVAANDVLSAQRVILKELETQFAGQAFAAARGSGAIEQMKNEIVELKKEIGEELLPVIIESAKGITEWSRDNKESIGDWAGAAIDGAILVKDVMLELGEFMRDDWKELFQFGLDATLIGVATWGESLMVVFEKIFTDLQSNIGVWLKRSVAKGLEARKSRKEFTENIANQFAQDPEGVLRRKDKDVVKREAQLYAEEQLKFMDSQKIFETAFPTVEIKKWSDVVEEIKQVHVKGFEEFLNVVPPELGTNINAAFQEFLARRAGRDSKFPGVLGIEPSGARGDRLFPGGSAGGRGGTAQRGLGPAESRFLTLVPSSAGRRDPAQELVKLSRQQLREQNKQTAATEKMARELVRLASRPGIQATDLR